MYRFPDVVGRSVEIDFLTVFLMESGLNSIALGYIHALERRNGRPVHLPDLHRDFLER
jgi:hypothetical protein